MTRNSTVVGTVLGAATVAMGLITGAFYIFACGVMPGLARSDDRVYVEVMRDINDAFENPVFFLSFMGALVLTAVSAWQVRGAPYRGWVWAAAAAYGLAFVVTVAFNIPLNDSLKGPGDPTALREHFEDPWLAWNVVRTVLSTVAVGCLGRALVLYGRVTPFQPVRRLRTRPSGRWGSRGQSPLAGSKGRSPFNGWDG